MQFFSIGQQAEGFIAIGQEATGVIAIGQMATGVIAIGQLARGVFAVGMLSVGLVSVGMLSLGVVHCIAMLGAGGSGTGMLVVPLCPKLPAMFDLPPLASRADVQSGRAGWLAVLVQRAPVGLGLLVDGAPFPARIGSALLSAASQAMVSGQNVLAYIVPAGPAYPGGGLEVTRLMRLPVASWRSPQFLGLSALQLGGLVIASAVYFWFGFAPVVDGVLAVAKG